jgi:hypothetical protein
MENEQRQGLAPRRTDEAIAWQQLKEIPGLGDRLLTCLPPIRSNDTPEARREAEHLRQHVAVAIDTLVSLAEEILVFEYPLTGSFCETWVDPGTRYEPSGALSQPDLPKMLIHVSAGSLEEEVYTALSEEGQSGVPNKWDELHIDLVDYIYSHQLVSIGDDVLYDNREQSRDRRLEPVCLSSVAKLLESGNEHNRSSGVAQIRHQSQAFEQEDE